MTSVVYTVGDTYPDLQGKVSWAGNLKTDTITGKMVANGETEGPFTSDLVMSANDSENPAGSSWSWTYDVQEEDTEVVGSYKLCLRLVHDNGDIETVDPSCKVEVKECG
jgi:hypothetical protein